MLQLLTPTENLFHFIQFITDNTNFTLDTTLDPELQYKKLYNWSISSPEEFWSSFLVFSNIFIFSFSLILVQRKKNGYIIYYNMGCC